MFYYKKILVTYKDSVVLSLLKIIKRKIQKLLRKLYFSGTIYITKRELSEPFPNKLKVTIKIKPLTERDIEDIVSLKQLSKDKVLDYFKNNSRCIGAYIGDELCGYDWCHFESYYYPFFEYNFSFLGEPYNGPVYVKPEYRGNGIHIALTTENFKILRNEGHDYVYSSVWPSNKLSINNIKLLGLRPLIKITAVRVFNRLVYKRVEEVDSW